MPKKTTALVLVSILSILLVFKPTSSLAQDKMEDSNEEMMMEGNMEEEITENTSSYDLFWPVVAGKVPGDTLYFLKGLKEKISELVIFSDIRKSDFNLTLSKKRLVETEKLLLERQDYDRAEKHIALSLQKLERAISLYNNATERGQQTNDLKNAIQALGERESKFLEVLAGKIPEEKRQTFMNTAQEMKNVVENI